MSYTKLACFVGGALFGSVGLKLLASEDAKHVYVNAAAAGLRAKDYVMQTVTTVQEETADIMAAAKELNETREALKAEELAEAEIVTEDETED